MQAPHSAFAALAQGSVSVPGNAPWWRRFFAFIGPGYLIAVGYMDPGNWATDIGGGSAFGYMLLSVVLAASVIAMLLQALSVRLGVAARLDLAQACRAFYPRPVSIGLWVLCEIAIVACDLAEVLGTAIALQLLFHLPLLWGVIVTAFDVFLILALQRFGFRKLEAVIIALLLIGSREGEQSLGADLWPAAIAIVLVLVGRAVAVYSIARAFARTRFAVDMATRHILFWGGQRGALALALALAAPRSLPEHGALISVAFAVVAFSIFVQGSTMPWLLRQATPANSEATT